MQEFRERFFYHSFPRRGASSNEEIGKGKQILAAIRDFGLVLTPQLIEWVQPTIAGSQRVLPVFQKRVCFTELSPSELAGHAERFGHFSLEFEIFSVRQLGAVPVFYVPQPIAEATDGSLVGAALVAIASDMRAVMERISALHEVLHGQMPVNKELNVKFGFFNNPDGVRDFLIDRDEAKNLLAAIGNEVTPWNNLAVGANALLAFFHPTDNKKTDVALEYYREREWRIAAGLFIRGSGDQPDTNLLRVLSASERQRLLAIDEEFFSRRVQTGLGEADTLDETLVLPGLRSTSIMQMVRRVIVPAIAVSEVVELLSDLRNPPPVVGLEELAHK